MQEIKHDFDGTEGLFYIKVKNKKVAAMYYELENERKLIIEHTAIDESLKGQGIGKRLLEKLVEYAREKHLTVLPLCPFANAIFKKTPEWHDVLS